MKLISILTILLFITSCLNSEGLSSGDDSSYEEPTDPVRKIQLLEVPPVLAEKKVRIDEMVNGDAGKFILKDHQIFLSGQGKVAAKDGLDRDIELDVWGSLLVPYSFNHKSKIISGYDFVSIEKKKDSFSTNDLMVFSTLISVPLEINRVDGLFKNVVHFELHYNGENQQLVNHPSYVYQKSGSFMVNEIYDDPKLLDIAYTYYKVNDTTYQRRFTVIRDQQGVPVQTIHISTYELVNEDLIAPTDLDLAAEVGQFFIDNQRFKLDYDLYNQAIVYFSTHWNGHELFDTFKEAMLFSFDEEGLAETAIDSFVFAEKIIAQEEPSHFFRSYMSAFTEAYHILDLSKEEAKAFANQELGLY